MNFEQLVSLLKQTHTELQCRAERSVNTALVIRNWLFGWYIVEYEQRGADRADYGTQLIRNLAEKLKGQIKGCSFTNLNLCRQFYQSYPKMIQTPPEQSPPLAPPESGKVDKDTVMSPTSSCESGGTIMSADIIQTLSEQLTTRLRLSWSHYVFLVKIEDSDERSFYEIESINAAWSIRELERQFNSGLYERLALSRDKAGIRKLAQEGQVVAHPTDLIKGPYVLEFLGLNEEVKYSETNLETAIINKLEHFLLELGKGFLFEARQKRFTFDADHFYVDLVFYNRLLRCYVLIDLKIGRLAHQDLGQMQMYVNYFDRHVKLPEENPTIGILLCKMKHDAMVELTLPENANVFAPQYQLYLPSKEELKAKLLAWTEQEQ